MLGVIVGIYSSLYADNNSQYADNNSQYAENSSQYAENSSQYAEISSQYAKNSLRYSPSVRPFCNIIGHCTTLVLLRRFWLDIAICFFQLLNNVHIMAHENKQCIVYIVEGIDTYS